MSDEPVPNDYLKLARKTMDSVMRGVLNKSSETQVHLGLRTAQAFAAIAQAEALERIANATERRNELLAEFNADNKAAAATHTEKTTASVSAFLNAHFPDAEEL